LEIEHTDKRNQDAAVTPAPNAMIHPSPYGDKETELMEEQEQHQKSGNSHSHQAQTSRDGEEIYFEAQVEGALCWKHAINMSLGSQIVPITHSLDVARAHYAENTHATFHPNGFLSFSSTV